MNASFDVEKLLNVTRELPLCSPDDFGLLLPDDVHKVLCSVTSFSLPQPLCIPGLTVNHFSIRRSTVEFNRGCMAFMRAEVTQTFEEDSFKYPLWGQGTHVTGRLST